MNLYLVTRTDTIGRDENRGVVVAAANQGHAFSVAADAAGDEGRIPWLDPNRSTWKLIGQAADVVKAGVILTDTLTG